MLADRILVKPNAIITKTETGLIIPDTAKQKPKIGTVISIGSDMGVSVGDTIYFGNTAGTEINIEGGEYLIMRETDILAIILNN